MRKNIDQLGEEVIPWAAQQGVGIKKKIPSRETPEESARRSRLKIEAELPAKKEFETFKSGLDAKYKDTPEGKLAKDKELADYKAGIQKVEIEQRSEADKDLAEFKSELKTKYGDKERALMDENQLRLLDKDIVAAEEKVITNADNEAVIGSMRFFNKYAKTPYVYAWKEEERKQGDIFKTKAHVEKVQLPKSAKGVQYTAEDIYFTAEQEKKTVEEVLDMLGVEY